VTFDTALMRGQISSQISITAREIFSGKLHD